MSPTRERHVDHSGDRRNGLHLEPRTWGAEREAGSIDLHLEKRSKGFGGASSRCKTSRQCLRSATDDERGFEKRWACAWSLLAPINPEVQEPRLLGKKKSREKMMEGVNVCGEKRVQPAKKERRGRDDHRRDRRLEWSEETNKKKGGHGKHWMGQHGKKRTSLPWMKNRL